MSQLATEQAQCLALRKAGKTYSEIAEATGLSFDQAYRRVKAAQKAERLDPALAGRLAAQGITDLAGLHSGWLLEKDKLGNGSSLYFYLGPDQEKLDFAQAVREVLSDIPRLPPMGRPALTTGGEGYANWLMLADLHVGGDYGSPALVEDFDRAIDDLVRRLPAAEKAVLFELGDLLDANDHKGVTPASGNPCDVKRDNHLQNTQTAIRLMRRAILRLAETHPEVEVHLIPGNHDRTAYFAVMLALEAHFSNNPRIRIVVPQTEAQEDFRVVSWGQCAVFPHHGDTAKWEQLKDVWADQFPDEWAQAKAFRLIATAHFHHDRKRDLVGCVAEQYRTLHRPNKWARGKGLFSHGSLTALTVHRDRGEEHRTISNIKPLLRGEIQ